MVALATAERLLAGLEVDADAMLRNLRTLPRDLRLGEALQVQRAVAGIGNMWMSEALWED